MGRSSYMPQRPVGRSFSHLNKPRPNLRPSSSDTAILSNSIGTYGRSFSFNKRSPALGHSSSQKLPLCVLFVNVKPEQHLPGFGHTEHKFIAGLLSRITRAFVIPAPYPLCCAPPTGLSRVFAWTLLVLRRRDYAGHRSDAGQSSA